MKSPFGSSLDGQKPSGSVNALELHIAVTQVVFTYFRPQSRLYILPALGIGVRPAVMTMRVPVPKDEDALTLYRI